MTIQVRVETLWVQLLLVKHHAHLLRLVSELLLATKTFEPRAALVRLRYHYKSWIVALPQVSVRRHPLKPHHEWDRANELVAVGL